VNRAVFLVDGFNLYHSILQAGPVPGRATLKWLDLKGLCTSYLSLAGERSAERASLAGVDYFSAAPTHYPQDRLERFNLYMRCLRGSGVRVTLARFKRKEMYCKLCRRQFEAHEEKETDVAIATRLFEVCHSDEADVVILTTGDTDLAPSVVTCRRLFPQKLIFFAFPYQRFNADLKVIAPESFGIKRHSYVRHQSPDPLVLPDGTQGTKPPTW